MFCDSNDVQVETVGDGFVIAGGIVVQGEGGIMVVPAVQPDSKEVARCMYRLAKDIYHAVQQVCEAFAWCVYIYVCVRVFDV